MKEYYNCTVFIKCDEECDTSIGYCPYRDIRDNIIYKIDIKK